MCMKLLRYRKTQPVNNRNRARVKGFASGYAALDALSAPLLSGNQGQVPLPCADFVLPDL